MGIGTLYVLLAKLFQCHVMDTLSHSQMAKSLEAVTKSYSSFPSFLALHVYLIYNVYPMNVRFVLNA